MLFSQFLYIIVCAVLEEWPSREASSVTLYPLTKPGTDKPINHLENVVWIYNNFDNNLGIENEFTNYLKDSVGCVLLNISPSIIFPNSALA